MIPEGGAKQGGIIMLYRKIILCACFYAGCCIAGKPEITQLFDARKLGTINELEVELQLTPCSSCVYKPVGNTLSYGVDNCSVAPQYNYFGDSIVTNIVFKTNLEWLKCIKSNRRKKSIDIFSIQNNKLRIASVNDEYIPPYDQDKMLYISDYMKSFAPPFTTRFDFRGYIYMHFNLFPRSHGVHIYAKRNLLEREVMETLISGRTEFRYEFGNLTKKVQKDADYRVDLLDRELDFLKKPLANFKIIIPEIDQDADCCAGGMSITSLIGKVYSPMIIPEDVFFHQTCSWEYTDYNEVVPSSPKHVIRQYSDKTGCLFLLTYQTIRGNAVSKEVIEQIDLNVDNFVKLHSAGCMLPFKLSDVIDLRRANFFKGTAVAVSGSGREINFCFVHTLNHPVLGFEYKFSENENILSINNLALKSISFFTGNIPSRFFYMSDYSRRMFCGFGSAPPVLVVPVELK